MKKLCLLLTAGLLAVYVNEGAFARGLEPAHQDTQLDERGVDDDTPVCHRMYWHVIIEGIQNAPAPGPLRDLDSDEDPLMSDLLDEEEAE